MTIAVECKNFGSELGECQVPSVRELSDKAMNWDIIQGRWKEFKGRVKERWGDLSNDDLDCSEGKRDQLVGKVQQKYGIAKEEADRQVTQFETGRPDD